MISFPPVPDEPYRAPPPPPPDPYLAGWIAIHRAHQRLGVAALIALASILGASYGLYWLKLEAEGFWAALLLFALFSVYGRATLAKLRCPACRTRWLTGYKLRCGVCGIPRGMLKSAFDEAKKNAAARATVD
jgi:hypothetical protein